MNFAMLILGQNYVGRWRFADFDAGEQRQVGLQNVPKPRSKVFGSSRASHEVVKVSVVERLDHGPYHLADICVVLHPLAVEGSANSDQHFVAVAVQAMALVIRRQMRQRMSCLKAEGFGDFVSHLKILPLCRRNNGLTGSIPWSVSKIFKCGPLIALAIFVMPMSKRTPDSQGSRLWTCQ
jgi:hypothetical protein